MDKSTDATVAVDLETAARVGAIGEYRYRLSRATRGDFTVAYYNEQIRGRPAGTVAPNGEAPDIPENRFALAGQHRQPFYGGSQLYLRLFAISDDAFLKEINTFAFSTRRDLTLRSSRFTNSRAGIVKTWDNGLAWIENSYYQDLIDPQPLALQKLPRVEAEHAVPLLGDLLVGRLEGQAIDYQRSEGYGGLRGDLGPEVFMPFHLGRALNGSFTGRLRETAYHLTDTEQVGFVVPSSGVGSHFRAAPELPRLDTDRSRELAEVSGRTGTEFVRVFDFRHFGFEKFRHSIEPELRYLFVPAVARPIFDVPLPSCASLPVARRRPGDNCDATLFTEGFLFDDRDAINRRNFVSYGFSTRLLARGPTPVEAATHEAQREAGHAGPGAPGRCGARLRRSARAAVGHGARRGADRRTARARAREHPSRLRHLPPDRGHQPRERHRPRDTADAGRLPGTLVQRDGQPRTLGDPRTDGRAVPARAVVDGADAGAQLPDRHHGRRLLSCGGEQCEPGRERDGAREGAPLHRRLAGGGRFRVPAARELRGFHLPVPL
ncbi:MAG: LPS-assembly protein LptD [Deltaproteobacteria bacterium]|nr:MAG: LPS-assembly protein LptD [Deltaproteobacteria bacterium]